MLRILVTLLFVGIALATNVVTRPAYRPTYIGGELTCRTNEVIQADGGGYGIEWTPDSADAVVYIALINGTSPVLTIASQISNTGTFIWMVPRSLTAGRYTIAIAGGTAGESPTDYTSSGEFIITGPSALSSSVPSTSVASSGNSVASGVEAQLSSIFQSRNSSATATGSGGATSTSGGGGAIVGSSATATRTGGSSSASATGTSGTEPVVSHADFAVIIFAFVCVLMQI